MSGVAPEKIRLVHVIFAIVFASLYLLTIVIDAETQIIPDEITITHFLAAWLFFFLARPDIVSNNWVANVVCMVALPAIFFVMCWLNWMGGGDVALAAGFGALFGWPLSAVVALCGFMMGGVVAVPMLLYLVARRKYEPGKHAVAFGPYLAVSAYICLFFGHSLVAWYFRLFGLKLLPDWSVTSLVGG
jgi:leader peptidase (prepilin peptidase)/N-methyltransferase